MVKKEEKTNTFTAFIYNMLGRSLFQDVEHQVAFFLFFLTMDSSFY